MNRQDINRLKNHVKAQGLRFFVVNKEQPRYGLITDGQTVIYWQFNHFNTSKTDKRNGIGLGVK